MATSSKAARSTVDDAEESLDGRHKHLGFDFLQPEKIRDAQKRRPNDPDYDPTTLYVPTEFLHTQTPGMQIGIAWTFAGHQQWWKIKSENFDTILFFKVGKFYELYHMDAVIGVEMLNLTSMKG